MGIFLEGFSIVATPAGFSSIIIGVAIGIVVGVLPGLGQGTALLLTLPVALAYPVEISLIIYASLLGATTFGDSLTSIVLGVPGSAQNVITVSDGYPMARRGEASRAIGLASFSSLIGALFGMVVVIIALPFIRILMYVYGSREYFITIVFAIVIVAVVSNDFWKGLASFGLGALISVVGVDATFGITRYSGGLFYFWGKIPIAVFIIGIFAFTSLVMLRVEGTSVADPSLLKSKPLDALRAFPETMRAAPVVFRSSIIGTVVGILPGIGGEVAQFVSYGVQKGISKNKEDYGKGEPKGLIASEAAVCAKDSGALLPTLCLGIPGSPEMSIMLGILLVLGIDIGPNILKESGGILWTILIAAIIGNILAGIICVFGSSIITKITIIPVNIVFIVTIMLSIAATFTWATNVWDCLMLIPFCLLGILLMRSNYPIPNLILGYVLGPLAEKSFHTTLQSGLYDPAVFLGSTVAKVLAAATVILLVYTAISKYRKRRKAIAALAGTASQAAEEPENSNAAKSTEKLVLAVVLFVIAILFAVFAPKYDLMKSGLFPLILAIMMGVSLLFVLFSETRGFIRLKRLKKAVNNDKANGWIQYWPTMIFLGVYALAMFALGFYVGNLVMVTVFFKIFDKYKLGKSVLMGVIFTAAVYLIFTFAFKSMLFPGALPMIIPNYFGGGSLRPFF